MPERRPDSVLPARPSAASAAVRPPAARRARLAALGAGAGVLVALLGAPAAALAASPTGGATAGSDPSSRAQVDPEDRGGGATVEAKGRTPEILEQIAECESGGDPEAISRDGHFRGKYQFSRETWRSVGGTGDPAAAPEDEQDRRALELFRREGLSPWPHCGRDLPETP